MTTLKARLYDVLAHSQLARLASYFHKHHLTILCFHSMALGDEHRFWPGVFISRDRLIALLEFLKASQYQVVPLDEGLQHLRGEITIDYPVVITIDDGWHSCIDYLLPILNDYDFPSTTYVTTYYCDHQIPVVNVLLQYWLWKKPVAQFSLMFDGTKHDFAGSPTQIVEQVERLIKPFNDQQKLVFLTDLAACLGHDPQDILQRRFANANYAELAVAARNPLNDIQLHTHTHRLPEDADGIEREINRNRDKLAAVLNHDLHHFCYPSGIWSEAHIEPLQQLGIHSATTLDEGLNSRGMHPLKLKRNLIVDDRSLTQLEVTMSGLLDVFRRIKNKG